MNMMGEIHSVFDAPAREQFARLYPEQAGMLNHGLAADPRLELGALAELGEALAPASVEYNAGNLPTGIRPDRKLAMLVTRPRNSSGIESCSSVWFVVR